MQKLRSREGRVEHRRMPRTATPFVTIVKRLTQPYLAIQSRL